jgi:hypothetical protein
MTCTTHHHACDCREARFQAMFQAQEARVERLEEALRGVLAERDALAAAMPSEGADAALSCAVAWSELREIRAAIKARDGESTVDEVRRVMAERAEAARLAEGKP